MEINLEQLGTTLAVGSYLSIGSVLMVRALFGRPFPSGLLLASKHGSRKIEFAPWSLFVIPSLLLAVGLLAEDLSDSGADDRREHTGGRWIRDVFPRRLDEPTLLWPDFLVPPHRSERELLRGVLIENQVPGDDSKVSGELSELAKNFWDELGVPLLFTDQCVELTGNKVDEFDDSAVELVLNAQNKVFQTEAYHRELSRIDGRLDFARAMAFASRQLWRLALLSIAIRIGLWALVHRFGDFAVRGLECMRPKKTGCLYPIGWIAAVSLVFSISSSLVYEVEMEEYNKRVLGYFYTISNE